MVDVYDLNPRMLPTTDGRIAAADGGNGGGVRGGWPSYIDQHVAQLDFDVSMMGLEEEEDDDDDLNVEDVFGSVMAGDPSMISTDSLDMDQLRARCEHNQPNDYKLTFEDSGQWTTSGIGGSFNTNTSSPPVPNSRRAQQLKVLRNNQKYNNNNLKAMDPITTGIIDTHHLSLRLLEELNNEAEDDVKQDEKVAKTRQQTKWRRDFLLDELLNNHNNNCSSSQTQIMNFPGERAELTTWGRIRDESGQGMEPFNSEKVYSLPELNRRQHDASQQDHHHFTSFTSSPAMAQQQSHRSSQAVPTPSPVLKGSSASSASKRPASLVVNFMDQQKLKTDPEEGEEWARRAQPTPPSDYVYSETYLGNGRYVDMNENEIGYVPPNTAPIQKKSALLDLDVRRRDLLGAEFDARDHHPSSISHQKLKSRNSMDNGGSNSKRRTFADFSSSRTVPDLKFIALSHKVPSICPSSNSLDNLLRRVKDNEADLDELLSECYAADSKRLILETGSGSDDAPDSGLGSSHSEGPSHIEDWSSLSVLLPRNVVEACSFFKTNSFLLSASSNNIEGRRPPRSFTSAGLATRHNQKLRRPATACHACLEADSDGNDAICCCDGRARSEEPFSPGGTTTRSAIYTCQLGQSPRARASHSRKLRLHAQELAIIGLPIYDHKRNLVERVVEGVAEIIRGASSVVLMTALERLLGDELLPGVRTWSFICQVTGPGPVTRSVYQLIRELEASEKPEHSRVSHFFKGLLSLHSLDAWLSYAALKEPVLRRCYAGSAFLLGAQSAYRSLWWRLMESVELLAVLNQCGGAGKRWDRRQQQRQRAYSRGDCGDNSGDGGWTRLPSDSRVPKSSSMPTKLCAKTVAPAPIAEEEETKLEDVEILFDGHKEVKIAIIPSIEDEHKHFQQKHQNVLPTLRPSRIPIRQSPSRSNNSAGTSSSSYLTTRSRSSSSRPTPSPAIICPVSEAIEECNNGPTAKGQGTALPLQKGERVRVLSVRGAFTRCSRLDGGIKGKLAIRNGIVPTKWLNFVGIGHKK